MNPLDMIHDIINDIIHEEIITVERAIEELMKHMDLSREEAGKTLSKPRHFAALQFIEQTPYGMKYAARPDEEGFYSTEEIIEYFMTGKEPNGKNILLLSNKRFFFFLDGLRKLDFDPSFIPSPSDLHIPSGDEESEFFGLFIDEQNSARAWKEKAESLEKELKTLQQKSPVYLSVTPGNPYFHPRIWGLAKINLLVNPPNRQRDIRKAIESVFSPFDCNLLTGKPLEHVAWAVSSREMGKPIHESEDWIKILDKIPTKNH